MGINYILRGFVTLAGISLLFVNGCSCSDDDSNAINCIQGTGGSITISGKATFDLVQFNTSTDGLDYSSTVASPIRGAVVELVCGDAIATTNTDANGNYSLSAPSGSVDLLVRVKAQMKQTGTPSWDFTVVDNTQSQALYVMDSAAFNADAFVSLDVNADSGWGGTSYTGTRVAGPFAILDSVYQAYNKVLATDPNAVFQPLKLNWSVDNVSSSSFNPSIGQILTSLFDGTQIYILGKENSDTDEYDDHVVIHEWGHYFEEFFSRADSIGGPHGTGDILDPRVAFGEGWGNAWSGMVTDDPVYRDSGGPSQAFGFSINVDTNTCTNPGWFSECSVQAILFDLYDSFDEVADTVSLGFDPIYSVLTNEQKNTPAVTSIFSFVKSLKDNNGGFTAQIDALVTDQTIDIIVDPYGDTETNDPGATVQTPVHTQLAFPGSVIDVCSTGENGAYNGLGVHRFVKFTPTTTPIDIVVNDPLISSSDPDIELFKNGVSVAFAETGTPNSESLLNVSVTTNEEYVLQLYEWDYYQSTGGPTCFNVSIN